MSNRPIDELFGRLLVRYGADWLRQWQGVDEELVKQDWMHELTGLPIRAIRYGMEHLPVGKPPTVGQFKALCLSAPPPPVKALPAPKPDRKRLAAEFAKLRETIRGERDPRAWIYALEARVKAGERLTEMQRAALQRASYALPAQMPVGEFTPIPNELLPPGMRSQA